MIKEIKGEEERDLLWIERREPAQTIEEREEEKP